MTSHRCTAFTRAALPLALALFPLLAAGGAVAETRLLEVVGAVPLDERTRQSSIPKDKAIEAALWEGVSRVAADLLVDSIVPEPEDGSNPVDAALGRDMVSYTKTFRIVEDQGERPTLFTDHPDAATEYVVVMEVEVEVDRVRRALVQAGLLEVLGAEARTWVDLEVRGLDRYDGYSALVEALESPGVGATRIDPRDFEAGRARVRVEGEWGARELLERLLAAAPPNLRLRPLEVEDRPPDDDRWGHEAGRQLLVLAASWTPSEPAAAR